MDIAISYARKRYKEAVCIKESLESRGFLVWMDDEGVTPGALHQAEIAKAFLSSSAVLVLDSAEWRESDYCIWEYNLSVKAGKRIAVFRLDIAGSAGISPSLSPIANIPAGNAEELADILHVGSKLAQAHADLLRLWFDSTRAGDILVKDRDKIECDDFWYMKVPDVDVKRYSKDVNISAAVEIVLSNNTGGGIMNFARQITVKIRKRKIRNKSMSVTAAFLVIICSVLSIVFFLEARESRDIALIENQKQQALSLAQQSAMLENSFDRLATATLAVEAADTPYLLSAYQSAYISNLTRQVFTIPQGQYLGAAFSGDNKKLVVTDHNQIYLANLSDGTLISNVTITEGIGARHIGVSYDGTHVAISNINGKLLIVDMNTGMSVSAATESSTSFFVDSSDYLWIGHSNGRIIRRPIPWTSSEHDTIYETGKNITALSVSESASTIGILTKEGIISLYIANGSGIEEIQSAAAFPGSESYSCALGDTVSLDADALIVSGDDYIALRGGAVSLYQTDTGTVVRSTQFQTASTTRSSIIPASLGNGYAMTYQGASSFERIIPGNAPNPVSYLGRSSRVGGSVLAGTQDGKLLANAGIDGQIELLHLDWGPLNIGNVAGVFPLPVNDGFMTIGLDGIIYNSHKEQLFQTGLSFRFQTPVMAGESMYLFSNDNTIVSFFPGENGGIPGIREYRIINPMPSDNIRLGNTVSDSVLIIYDSKRYGILSIFDDENAAVIMEPLHTLADNEVIWMAAVNADGSKAVLKTSHHRLLIIDVRSHEILNEKTLPMIYFLCGLTFNAYGDLLVQTLNNGIILLDENSLDAKNMRILTSGTVGITPFAQGEKAILLLSNGDFEVIDTNTLLTIQHIPLPKDYRMRIFSVNPESTRLWHIGINQAGSGFESDIYLYHLFDSVRIMDSFE
ncbi:MAG: toll/interleukin-1 receptor domain-containing protein [Defluviitaleaceae bacterium]|nr:toll/interleukin-1 receptor domain-containing protein [Defluviitaleaceae bacterium]